MFAFLLFLPPKSRVEGPISRYQETIYEIFINSSAVFAQNRRSVFPERIMADSKEREERDERREDSPKVPKTKI